MFGKKYETKLHKLLIGKRPLKKRLHEALWPSLSLAFILFFFGPLDLSHIAGNYVEYTVPDILPACLKVFSLVFGALFLVSLMFGGEIHIWLCSLSAGLAMAFYIQGGYLNIDLGALDGAAIDWQKYGDNALINLAVFIAILLIPFLISFFSKKLWRRYIIFSSLLLVLMQAVPLGMMLADEYRSRTYSEKHYLLSKEKEFELGGENIVVFILDYTGPAELSLMLDKYPNALDFLHDFTQFDNYNTEYVGTFPASAYLLTHEPYDWNVMISDWFNTAWHSADALSFYSQMQNNGWETRVFNETRHAAGTLENEYGLISNVKLVDGPQRFTINDTVFRKLIKLSFYRYFPLIMKAPFWIYTGELGGMKKMSEEEMDWDQIYSVQKYLDQRLSVEKNGKVYITYHWAGSHEPYLLDEYGRRPITVSGANHAEDQLAGHFYVISEYLQQMKDFQIYDSSSIIITADHGDFSYPHSILFIKPAGQRQDHIEISHAPVSQSDFMETIAEFAGMKKGQYGQSFFDIPEDEERERCTYIRSKDDAYPLVPGNRSNAVFEYCYTGDSETIHEMIFDEEYNSYPLKDSYY